MRGNLRKKGKEEEREGGIARERERGEGREGGNQSSISQFGAFYGREDLTSEGIVAGGG